MLLSLFLKYGVSRRDEKSDETLADYAVRLTSHELSAARSVAYDLCQSGAYRNTGIFAVGLVAFSDGDYQSAKNSWNILAQSGCQTPLVLFANGLVDLKMGKIESLPDLINSVRHRYPEFYEIDFLEALYLVQAKQHEQAKILLERIISSHVLTDAESREMGVAYAGTVAELGFTSDAVALCNEIRGESGGGAECVRVLFECHAAMGNRQAAGELFASLRTGDVSLATAASVCSALIALTLHEQAIKLIDHWLNVDPVNTELLTRKALVLARMGNDEGAQQAKIKLDQVLFSRKKGIPFFISDDFIRNYMLYHAITLVNWDACHTLYNAILHVIRNDVDGDIVECGVFRGGISAFMARVLVENGSTSRKLFLCDTYEGMTVPDENDLLGSDSAKASSAVNLYFPGLAKIDEKSVLKVVRDTGYPQDNVVIVKGPVEETLPQNAPDKICILRLDTDWYRSTLHELETLMPRVAKYGIVIVDDYASWDGSRKAFHEYAERNSLRYFPTIDIIQGSLTFMKCD